MTFGNLPGKDIPPAGEIVPLGVADCPERKVSAFELWS
jgi:hypothetical protein